MPDTGAQQPSHLWSLEEIEALLSEHKTQPSAQPEPERSPLPGIEGDGPSIALDKAKDAVEEETFEPLLPLFEETGDIFDPLSPPPTAQEAPLQEDAPPPITAQPEPPPAKEPPMLSPAERLVQMEEVLKPITGMQEPFDPTAERGGLIGGARENWEMPKVGQPLLGADKYRERFFREPTIKIPIEPQPGQERAPLIDRPGLIRKKSALSATADLEPLPTLIAAEEEIGAVLDQGKTREVGSLDILPPQASAPEKQFPKDMVDGQLLLEGFQEERPASTLDEEEAEMRLHAIRKEKIKKFKLAAVEEPAFPAESPVEPSPAPDAAKERPADAQNGPIGEYTTPSQKAPLRSLLRRRAAIENDVRLAPG